MKQDLDSDYLTNQVVVNEQVLIRSSINRIPH